MWIQITCGGLENANSCPSNGCGGRHSHPCRNGQDGCPSSGALFDAAVQAALYSSNACGDGCNNGRNGRGGNARPAPGCPTCIDWYYARQYALFNMNRGGNSCCGL